MSQENVEIVGRVFEAFSHPGPPPIELFDPEVEVWESSEFPGELAGKGYDNLVRANETLFDAFEELSAEWERFFDLDDRILVFVRILGFGKGSGARVEAAQAHLFRLRDGKVTEWCLFVDRSKALEAAGLSE
jgi:ketosteroid isomerase-like protein